MSYRYRRYLCHIWSLFCLSVIVHADSCAEEVSALRHRVAQIERLLKMESVDDESSSLMQLVSDFNVDVTTVIAMKAISIPVPVIKNDHQTLQPTFLVAIATSNHKLSLYSESGHVVVESELPMSCDLVTMAYEGGDENLLAIGGCETIQVASLTAWRDALSQDIKASIMFDVKLSSPSVPVTAVYVQNHRYLKQFTVGTGVSGLLVYRRNGTLQYQATTEGNDRVVSVKQQRPRHLSFATPKAIGFVRMPTSSFSTEICSLDDDSQDEITSFTHNPRQGSILYAATQNGHLLVFDTNYNRRQKNSCGLRFSLEIDPGFGVSVSAVSDYVFVTSSKFLFVLNISGDPLIRPRIISNIALNFSNSNTAPLLSVTRIKNNVRLSVAERGGTHVRTFNINVTPDSIQQTFALPRAPIFLLIMIGTIVYQLGRKKLGKSNSELTDEDKRMIDSIINGNHFDTNEVVEGDPFDSREKVTNLRHRRIRNEPREGEIQSVARPTESSGDDSDLDERHHKKIN